MADRLQIRRDTADNWTEANPILAQGEWGYELDFNRLKIGDGVLPWVDLPYFAGGGSGYVLKELFTYEDSATFTLQETPSDIIAVDLRGQVLDGVSGLAWELDGDDITILYDLQAGDSIQVIYTVGSIGGSAVTTAQAQTIALGIVNAQKDEEGGVAANDTSILNIDEVSSLSTLNRRNRTRFIIGGVRGAGSVFNFRPSSDSLVIDNGIVFGVPDGYAVREYSGSVKSEWFGLVSDYNESTGMGTDNTTQINNLFKYKDVELPVGGNFFCDGNVLSSFGSKSAMRINGNGSTLWVKTRPQFNNESLLGSATLTADTSVQDSIISVSSVPIGLKKGDLVCMKSTALWYYENRGETFKGGTNEVISITGTDISLKYPVADFYDISEETVSIQFYARKELSIENLEIKMTDPLAVGCFIMSRLSNVQLNNFRLNTNLYSGLRLEKCIDVKWTNSSVDLDIQAGYTENVGYGAQVRDCTNILFSGVDFFNCRRGVDFSGEYPSRWGRVTKGVVVSLRFNGSSGIGSHGGADFIDVVDNTILTTANGVRVRGGNFSITENKFSYCESCVYISSGNKSIIHNNIVGEAPDLFKDNSSYNKKPLRMVLVDALNNTDDQIDGVYELEITNNSGSIQGAVVQEQNSHLRDVRYTMHGNNFKVSPQVTSVENRFYYTDFAGRLLKNATIRDNKIVNFGAVSYNYPFLAGNVNVDFQTCVIDSMIMPASFINKFEGGGTLGSLESNVIMSCDTKKIKLNGSIRVNVVTDTASVRVGPFPVYTLNRDMFFEMLGTLGTDKHLAQYQRTGQSRSDYLHIGAPGATVANGLWPVGSYQLTFNLELVINASQGIVAQ